MEGTNGISGPVQVYEHNWLYSVVPAGVAESRFVGGYTSPSQEVISVPLNIYLAGYCRNCGKAFSQMIPFRTDGEYWETAMSVPQYGCLPPKRP